MKPAGKAWDQSLEVIGSMCCISCIVFWAGISPTSFGLICVFEGTGYLLCYTLVVPIVDLVVHVVFVAASTHFQG